MSIDPPLECVIPHGLVPFQVFRPRGIHACFDQLWPSDAEAENPIGFKLSHPSTSLPWRAVCLDERSWFGVQGTAAVHDHEDLGGGAGGFSVILSVKRIGRKAGSGKSHRGISRDPACCVVRRRPPDGSQILSEP